MLYLWGNMVVWWLALLHRSNIYIYIYSYSWFVWHLSHALTFFWKRWPEMNTDRHLLRQEVKKKRTTAQRTVTDHQTPSSWNVMTSGVWTTRDPVVRPFPSNTGNCERVTSTTVSNQHFWLSLVAAFRQMTTTIEGSNAQTNAAGGRGSSFAF